MFQCMTSRSLGLVGRAQGFSFSLPGFCFILMSFQLPPCSNVGVCYSLVKNSTFACLVTTSSCSCKHHVLPKKLLRERTGFLGLLEADGVLAALPRFTTALQVSRNMQHHCQPEPAPVADLKTVSWELSEMKLSQLKSTFPVSSQPLEKPYFFFPEEKAEPYLQSPLLFPHRSFLIGLFLHGRKSKRKSLQSHQLLEQFYDFLGKVLQCWI